LEGSSKPLALVEGAFDTLAMRELCAREQIDRDVLGLPGVQSWNKAWNAYVKGRSVVIAVDNDEAADEACPKLAKALRAAGAVEVVRRIPIGAKDWASLLETEVAS
jgi:DNA primase